MALKATAAPHLRQTRRPGTREWTTCLILLPLAAFSGVYYGMRPVCLLLAAVVSANVCELAACLLMRRSSSLFDGSATLTGMLIGLLMSPVSPYWLPVVASAFAVWVVKMPFGGHGHEPFQPAAAGIALVTQCFPSQLFTYPAPNLTQPLPLGETAGVVVETSPAALLASGTAPSYSPEAWLLGQIPGPAGATVAILLIACAAALFLRRIVSPLIPLSYLAVCAVWTLAFPRAQESGMNGVFSELCSGYLLFSGIFLLPSPVTAPRYWLGRIVYGLGGGCLTMLLRTFGRFEEGACFAVLLMNALAPAIDRLCWQFMYFLRNRRKEALP